MPASSKNPLDQLGGVCTKIVASYEVFAKNHHISANELAVFYSLWANGCRTQKQIADEYLIAKQTIHTLCKRFEEQGFIKSQTGNKDKRKKIMTLTDKGKVLAQPVSEILLGIESKIIDEFGADRLAFLLSEMEALQGLMAERLEH